MKQRHEIAQCDIDIPEPLLRAAAAAEQRQEAALDRVLVKLGADERAAVLLDHRAERKGRRP